MYVVSEFKKMIKFFEKSGLLVTPEKSIDSLTPEELRKSQICVFLKNAIPDSLFK